ncbi:MAG TPA: sigma-54 dependent transcriptional regulator [Verrucomicrobiae bacterium]|jgi:DNA-binding NtrC family response regulator|nr:sigma-54 dependent transcriptional regulator [Verrucomicrobiae bacterium]
MKSKILVVDDENDLRQLLAAVLGEHYDVSQAASGAALKKLFPQPAPDVVLLDVKLPDADGLDLLTQIKRRWPDTEVILLSGYGTMSMAIEAGRRGAYTFLTKPFENEKLLADVKCAIDRKEQSAENLTLRRALETMSGTASPIFKSPAMQDVVRTVERVAPSDVTLLITGESGSGKEVIADLIHTLSPRNKNKIIKINCAALPRELIESELFGSVKGAFTGAHSDREGLFRQAEGGTLFLDEISEMPIDTQSKLLRVLQDQEVRPVGGKITYKTNCRIVAATNREPQAAIKDGKLREDLFYRISAISVHLPPLRDRRDDIMPLAGVFLKRFAAQANRDIQGFNQEAIERLTDFDWPGNVRQLQNEIQRAVLLCEGSEIDVADLSISNTKPVSEMAEETDSGYTLLESVERNTIVQTLKAAEGNKLEAAKRLGIGRQTLYNKLKAYGIEV